MTWYEVIITEVPRGSSPVVLDVGLVGLGRATCLLDTMAKSGEIENVDAVRLYDAVEVTGGVLGLFLDAVATDAQLPARARKSAASLQPRADAMYEIYLSEV